MLTKKGMTMEPPDKRRKTEKAASSSDSEQSVNGAAHHSASEDLWDDIGLSQADLDDIDDREFMASQSMSSSSALDRGNGGVSVGAASRIDPIRHTPHAGSSSRMQHKMYSVPPQSVSQQGTPQFQQPLHPPVPRRKLMTSKPATLSSHAPTSVPSACSTSITTSSLSLPHSLPVTSSASVRPAFPGVVKDRVHQLEAELKTSRIQLDAVRQELYGKDGEIHSLRDALHKKESDVMELREEKIHLQDQYSEEQNERERRLKADVERLYGQIQFKEREIVELQDRCRNLENRQQQAQVNKQNLPSKPGSSAHPVPVTSAVSPPPVRRVPVERHSPHASTSLPSAAVPAHQGGFPTAQSFRSEVTVKEEPYTGLQQSQKTDNRSVRQIDAVVAKKERVTKRIRLKVNNSMGAITGPSLAQELLSPHTQSLPSTSHPLATDAATALPGGVIRLLHHLPAGSSLNLSLMRLDREQSGSMVFSPHRAARLSRGGRSAAYMSPALAQGQDGPAAGYTPPQAVAEDSITLAMKALSELLNTSVDGDILTRSLSFISALTHKTIASTPSSLADKSVKFIRLLHEYLKHYLEIVSIASPRSASASPTGSAGDSAKATTSSGRSSNSFDSSLESVTNSLDLLLKDGAVYANTVEQSAVTALYVLHILIHTCPDFYRYVLTEECEKSPSPIIKQTIKTQKMDASAKQRLRVALDKPSTSHTAAAANHNRLSHDTAANQSSSSTDVSPNTTSSSSGDVSSTSLSSHEETDVKSNDAELLHVLLRLANPGSKKDSSVGINVLEVALDVLTALAYRASCEECDRLYPVLSHGVLHNCLNHGRGTSVVTRALQLFNAIIPSQKVVSSLCLSQDQCILSTLYDICTDIGSFSMATPSICNLILKCLFCITSTHRQGYGALLESDCHCTVKVVKSIVMMLCTELAGYEETLCDQSQVNLDNGLLFLHGLSQRDAHFSDHHMPVEHNYVLLICGLTHLYKHLPIMEGGYENEFAALHDLWDFDQDDSELSQDEDQDDSSQMDTG